MPAALIPRLPLNLVWKQELCLCVREGCGQLCIKLCIYTEGCLTLLSLQEEAKAAEEEGVPDEEGWVKVTRKGRKPGLPRTEAANLRLLEKEKQKRARKELLNFYAWQHREAKRERECASLLLPCPCLSSLSLWPQEHPSASRAVCQ